MLVTNLLICGFIIVVALLLYSLHLTDRVVKQIKQRSYDNYATSYKNHLDIKYNEEKILKINKYIDDKANCLGSIEKHQSDVEYIIRTLKDEGIIKKPLFQLPD